MDALAEDGMVEPSLPLAFARQEDGHPLFSGKSIPPSFSSLKTSNAQYAPDATYMVASATIDINSGEGEHGNKHPEGASKGFIKGEHDISMVEEPETEIEGFIIGQNNIDMIQEPIAEGDGFVKGAPISRDLVGSDSANAGSIPRIKRVQWNDSHGKELVHVLEFEVSDTGDSEEDDDDTDSHACACTIQ